MRKCLFCLSWNICYFVLSWKKKSNLDSDGWQYHPIQQCEQSTLIAKEKKNQKGQQQKGLQNGENLSPNMEQAQTCGCIKFINGMLHLYTSCFQRFPVRVITWHVVTTSNHQFNWQYIFLLGQNWHVILLSLITCIWETW